MELNLKVLRFDDDFVDYDLSTTIGSSGGSIGRAAQNDLVLPDTEGYVSRVHAKIETEGDRFYIIDSSSNGTLLLEQIPDDKDGAYNEVFIHQDKRELFEGSYIVIGQFEIEIQFDAAAPATNPEKKLGIPEPTIDSTLADEEVSVKKSLKQPIFNATPVAESNKEDYELQSVDVSPMQHQFTVPEVQPDKEKTNEVEDVVPEEFNIDDFFGDGGSSNNEQAPDQNPEEDDIFANLQDPFAEPIQSEVIDPAEIQTEQQNLAVNEGTSEINIDESSAVDGQSQIAEIEVLSPLVEKPISVDQPDLVSIPAHSEPIKTGSPTNSNSDQAVNIEQPIAKSERISSDAFFKGIGLDINEIPEELDLDKVMFNAGKMLRELLDVNISLLEARKNLKREFSSSLTVVQKEENNPLKFCQSIDEALPYLFFESTPGFLSGQRAVNESVSDLRAHQLAMMAGIQAAIHGTISRFDPDMVESVCEKGHFNKGSKYWEYYKESFENLSKLAQADFFGNEFATAYEKQIKAMKNQDRS